MCTALSGLYYTLHPTAKPPRLWRSFCLDFFSIFHGVESGNLTEIPSRNVVTEKFAIDGEYFSGSPKGTGSRFDSLQHFHQQAS